MAAETKFRTSAETIHVRHRLEGRGEKKERNIKMREEMSKNQADQSVFHCTIFNQHSHYGTTLKHMNKTPQPINTNILWIPLLFFKVK